MARPGLRAMPAGTVVAAKPITGARFKMTDGQLGSEHFE
jgi:hypothetical protein